MLKRLLVLTILACGLCVPHPVQATPVINDGDQVVFLGDSITNQRLFTTNLISYYTLRYPRTTILFRNSGKPGDTAPDGLARLDTTVLNHDPNIVPVMFGMNDAAWDPSQFEAGMEGIVAGLKAAGVQPVIITSTTTDGPRDNYSNTRLAVLRQMALDLATAESLPFYDLFTLFADVREAALADDPQFAITYDGIHPYPCGHVVITYAYLKALGETKQPSGLEIDALSQTVDANMCTVQNLSVSSDQVTFTRRDESMPISFYRDAEIMFPYVPILEEHNYYPFKVTNLAAGLWTLTVDGLRVSDFTHSQLAAGINLSAHYGPWTRLGEQVYLWSFAQQFRDMFTAATTIDYREANRIAIVADANNRTWDWDLSLATTLVYSIVDPPDHGSLTAPPATAQYAPVIYTPNPGYTGLDQFTYAINDGSTQTNEAAVSIHVYGAGQGPIDGLVGNWNFDDMNDLPSALASEGQTVATVVDANRDITLTVRDAQQRTLTLDSSDYGNVANIEGSPQIVTGKSGCALQFDGVWDAVDIPVNPAFDSNTGTWCLWFKTDGNWGVDGKDANYETRGEAILMSRHNWANTANSSSGLSVFLTPAGYIRLQSRNISGAQTGVDLTGTSVLTDNNWHHVAVTYSQNTGGNNQIYVDGYLQVEGASTRDWWFHYQRNVRVADSFNAWWEEFAGAIDDVRIYNRVLNPAEIATLAGVTGPVNLAPYVDAGPDQEITLPTDTVNLDATVTDDNLPDPPNSVTLFWTVEGGPGTVIFGDVGAVDTTAQFSASGIYLLRLTADDSALTEYDEVIVTVNPEPGTEPEYSLYYPLDDAGGAIAADSCANDNDGAISGTPNWTTGHVGGALQFDGAANMIQASGQTGITDLPVGDFTVTWWQKWDQDTAENSDTILGKYGSGGWQVNVSQSLRRLTLEVKYDSTNAFIRTGNDAIAVDTWQHVAVVWTCSDKLAKIYLDGIETTYGTQTAGAGNYKTDDGTPIQFGRAFWSANYYRGMLDEIRIYNRALSQLEVQDVMNYTSAPSADIDASGTVDYVDLGMLADQWLWTGAAGGIVEDIIVDGSIDFIDYAQLADQWFSGN